MEASKKITSEKDSISQKWIFLHQLSAVVFTRTFILGPIERMKIILQTKHLSKYANPRSDMPKGVADLTGSKFLNLINQAFVIFYRNFNEPRNFFILQRAIISHAYISNHTGFQILNLRSNCRANII